jgi:mono/diheme cytochrome c family protein
MNNAQGNGSHFFRVITRFGLIAVSVAMFYGPTVTASEVVERGTKNYVLFCQGCHGEDKAGLSSYQGGLEDLQARLDGETIEQMPDFYGVFSEDEVVEIYAYLKATD